MSLEDRAREFATRHHAAIGQVRKYSHRADEFSKICGGCQARKPLHAFNRCKRASMGVHNHCRDCQKKFKRRWYLVNAEAERFKSSIRGKTAAARVANKLRYERHKDRILEKNRTRRRQPSIRTRQNQTSRLKLESNPCFKLAVYMRVRTRKALKGIQKSARTMQLLGCDIDTLKKHLESQFKPGMSWDNYCYTGWHVDHIKPCAKFDLSDPAQQLACFSFRNLQPLWHKDNIRKGANNNE